MSKRKGILLIGAVFVLAAAGVVYAHWTETLTVDATVQTGNAEMGISWASTDDDGIFHGWEIIRESEDQNGTEYDHWDAGVPPAQRTSSNDPSAYRAGSRYDKDVGRCRVLSFWPPPTKALPVLVENTYPSYYCTITGHIRNYGSVPMKEQAIRVEVCEADCANPVNWSPASYDILTDRFTYGTDLEFGNRTTSWCGRQYDPPNTAIVPWDAWLHVLQDPGNQGKTYQVRLINEFVNWNEWSVDACEGYDQWGNGSGSQKYPITP